MLDRHRLIIGFSRTILHVSSIKERTSIEEIKNNLGIRKNFNAHIYCLKKITRYIYKNNSEVTKMYLLKSTISSDVHGRDRT